MATTPPPPRRVHTPPTPLHGAKYDSYEPYSPRRSSRVAAQRKNIAIPAPSITISTPQKHRRVRAVTPTNAEQSVEARTSSQTFSPPSSPFAPIPGTPHTKGKAKAGYENRSPARNRHAPSESSGELARESESTQLDPRAMLPTPSKTPKKRALQQSSISSTARVLFPGRPATIEDAMPDPKKSRRSKKNAFSLGSFEALHDEAEGSTIPIYTDTKERLPSLDEDEDNPFITKKADKSVSTRSTRRTQKDSKAAQMEQAMRNNEGVIVTFRGKKIFRKFDDDEDGANVGEEDTWSDLEIRRQAGAPDKDHPFLRSSYKPRLLFPTEEQRRAREAAANEADEEALTDIEVPLPQSSRNTAPEARTPVRHRFRAITPPSTVRKTRSTKKTDTAPLAVDTDVQGNKTEEISPVRSKKTSPFDMWRRTKSTSKPSSKKREGEPLDVEGTSLKRARAS